MMCLAPTKPCEKHITQGFDLLECKGAFSNSDGGVPNDAKRIFSERGKVQL